MKVFFSSNFLAFFRGLAILEPQIYVVLKTFGAENIIAAQWVSCVTKFVKTPIFLILTFRALPIEFKSHKFSFYECKEFSGFFQLNPMTPK